MNSFSKRVFVIVGLMGIAACSAQQEVMVSEAPKGYSDSERASITQLFEVPDKNEAVAEVRKRIPLPRSRPHFKSSIKQKLQKSVISDGNYASLSPAWTRGVPWLIKTGRCDRFDFLIKTYVASPVMARYAKAQMIVESNCVPTVIVKGDHGLFQVKIKTCKDVGIIGDLTNPKLNIKCAARYRRSLCKRYKKCSLAGLFVAYNAGPKGSERVKNLLKHEYVRKLNFVLVELKKQKRSI